MEEDPGREYPGMLGPVGSWSITRLPICFTGALARTMVKYILVSGSCMGAAVGIVIAVLILIVFGAEGSAHLIGFAVGAVVGLLIGLYITVPAISGGTCTRPPGSFGFCINEIYMKIPGVEHLLPWPPFIEAARAQCRILVPPESP